MYKGGVSRHNVLLSLRGRGALLYAGGEWRIVIVVYSTAVFQENYPYNLATSNNNIHNKVHRLDGNLNK